MVSLLPLVLVVGLAPGAGDVVLGVGLPPRPRIRLPSRLPLPPRPSTLALPVRLPAPNAAILAAVAPSLALVLRPVRIRAPPLAPRCLSLVRTVPRPLVDSLAILVPLRVTFRKARNVDYEGPNPTALGPNRPNLGIVRELTFVVSPIDAE